MCALCSNLKLINYRHGEVDDDASSKYSSVLEREEKKK